jgi:hypothetical protein
MQPTWKEQWQDSQLQMASCLFTEEMQMRQELAPLWSASSTAWRVRASGAWLYDRNTFSSTSSDTWSSAAAASSSSEVASSDEEADFCLARCFCRLA